jgi:hypothetical protein
MHSKPNQPTRPPVKPGRPSSFGTEWALRSASTSANGSATSRVSTTWPFAHGQRVAMEGVHARRAGRPMIE